MGIEGYSYGSTGFHFQTGENCACLILALHKMCQKPKILKIPPSVVKQVGTGKGNAKKEDMVAAFCDQTGKDLLKMTGAKKVGNPESDIADAYFVMLAAKKSFTSPPA